MITDQTNEPDISGRIQTDTNQGSELAGRSLKSEEQPEPQVRAVPNIPRRAQDPLPERPERGGSSGNKGLTIILFLAVVLIMLFLFLKK